MINRQVRSAGTKFLYAVTYRMERAVPTKLQCTATERQDIDAVEQIRNSRLYIGKTGVLLKEIVITYRHSSDILRTKLQYTCIYKQDRGVL